ncbi:MAG TPA: type II toxin-antitoxin system ParD family antitoxin [Tepidisphaeraceae bacterium]|nr:type II toxin-antitoxin system ParD family antitoxin [Tepidisphaeraceae bacterium]
MTLEMSSEMLRYIERQSAAGRFSEPGEIVLAALKLLDDHTTMSDEQLSATRQAVRAGLDELDAGQGAPWDASAIWRSAIDK